MVWLSPFSIAERGQRGRALWPPAASAWSDTSIGFSITLSNGRKGSHWVMAWASCLLTQTSIHYSYDGASLCCVIAGRAQEKRLGVHQELSLSVCLHLAFQDGPLPGNALVSSLAKACPFRPDLSHGSCTTAMQPAVVQIQYSISLQCPFPPLLE